MLDVADVLHVYGQVCRVLPAIALLLGPAIRRVVILPQQSVLRRVREALVHPPTDAAVVVSVAVEQLLYRVLLQLLVDTCDVGKAFDGRGSAEGPAATATPLIVRDGDRALIEPVLVVWHFKQRLVLEVSLIRGIICVVPEATAIIDLSMQSQVLVSRHSVVGTLELLGLLARRHYDGVGVSRD